MTADPVPTRLLTSAEFAALPELEGRYELQGGSVVMAASPRPRHQECIFRLQVQLDEQLPPGLEVVSAVDVDLELVPADEPGFVRVPDLVVVTSEGLSRREQADDILRAVEIVVAVEVLSPSNARLDRTLKRAEYADAGIPRYWMIDIDEGPSLTACHLAGEFGYSDSGPVTGTFTADEPFPLSIDLDRLVRRR